MAETSADRPIKLDEIAAIVLGLLTIVGSAVVIAVTPAPASSGWTYLVWIITLAAALNLGIVFESGDANFGNIIVAAAFLALGFDPGILITLAGVWLGELVRVAFHRQLNFKLRSPRHTLIAASSNLSIYGLSLLAGGLLYRILGGPLPIISPSAGSWTMIDLSITLLPLLGFFFGYLTINYALFALYLRLEGRSVHAYVRDHWRAIAALEIIPMVFSAMIASAALNMPLAVFAIYCGIIGLGMFITHSLSTARTRLEQRVRELASLSAVGQAVANSLELPDVLEAIHRQTRQLMDARYFYVALHNEEERKLIFPLAYEHNQRARYDSRPFHKGLTEYVIESRQPLLIQRDVRGFVDQLGVTPGGPMAQSWLGVPIIFGDQVLGVIAVQNLEEPDRYDAANRDILTAIAAQAATAIHNAQTFVAQRHHAMNLAILNSVSMAINSTLDLNRVLDIIVTSVGRVMGNQKASIFLADDASQSVSLAASHNLSQNYLTQSRALPIGADVRSQAVATRQPLLVNDVQLDPRLIGFRRMAEAEGFRAFADVPLQTHGQAIGALTVYYAEPHHFTLTEIDLLNTFANQAAVAVANAKSYRRADEALARRIEQLAALEQIGRDLSSSLDFDQVMRRVLERAVAATGSTYGTIALWNEAQRTIRVGFVHGYTPEDTEPLIRTAWPGDRGVIGRAIHTGEPQCIRDVRVDPDYYAYTPDVRSEMVILIQKEKDILGIINLESTAAGRFDQQAVDFVSQLATQAALALQNARLFAGIAEARDKLQAILNSTHDGILMFDAAARIVMVNPELERMWGVPRAALEGRALIDLIDEPAVDLAAKMGFPPDALRAQLDRLRHDQPIEWPKQVHDLSDGAHRRFVERVSLPVLDAASHPIGWMLVLRDVTEERELQQLRDDLTNTIIHDLRSPLGTILGSLYMLEDMITPDNPDSDERQSVSISMRSAQRMLDLVNSLLDISKLKSGQALIEPKPASLDNVVEAAIEHVAPLATESGIMIVHYVPSDLPLVLIDGEKINRVLINLLDNALKFTPEGGHVTVLAERWANDPSFVRCAVRDTGPGIPPEFRMRIFDRFVQIADQIGRRRGSGIGLSFCHLAVEAHGGQIWVDDAPEGGSEFSFTVRVA